MLPKPAAMVMMPQNMFERLFTPAQLRRLEQLCDVLSPLPNLSIDDPAVRRQCAKVQVVITSWGTPAFGQKQVDLLPNLELVAHAAGSVKTLIDPALLQTGVRVTSATAANAQPVAEFTLAHILLANKRVDDWIALYRDQRSKWIDNYQDRSGDVAENVLGKFDAIGNFGKTVGIIGASRVGRYLIKLLEPFDLHVLVFDPLLLEEDADMLGVQSVSLDELLSRSDVVSLNAPALPQTFHMIGSNELSLMRNGSLFINTARGSLVDHNALRTELMTGRINAVLDVSDPEPLLDDDRLFDLPNVVVTPHISGSLGVEIHRMTDLILDEIEAFVSEGKLVHEILFEQWNFAA